MSDASQRIANLTPQQRELLKKLAAKKKAEAALAARIEPSAGPPRLSYQQRGLWVFQAMNPDSAAYNDGSLIRIRGPLDTEILRRSIEFVVNRHDSLRMRFESAADGPMLVVDPPSEYALNEIDLGALSPEEQEAKVQDLTRRKLNAPFDLAVEGVCRTALIRLGPERHALYVVIHHIANDAWSWGIFIGELLSAYESFSKGAAPQLPPLRIQYSDYSAWQGKQLEEKAWDRKLEFWREAWEDGVPTVELPADRPRPASPSFRGGRAQLRIGREATQAIKALARESKTTLFNVALAAYYALLRRYTGQSDLVIGTPVANRQQPELEPVMGFFVNMVAVPVKIEGDATFRQLLQATHDSSRRAFVAQDVPFERVVEEFQAVRDASRAPIFQSLFVLQSAPTPKLEVSGLEFERQELHESTARYDLTISLTEGEGELYGFLEYSEELFERATGLRLAEHFTRLLAGAAGSPDSPVSKLPMLSPEEERQVLLEWNDTARAYPTDACLHHLFEARAAERPDAIAAESGGRNLTYRELNERANQVARKLRAEFGVGPDAIVGLMFERSLEMIVAILGTLKAGGAYLPIDPAYPEDRVAFIGQDSACRAVLSQSKFLAKAALAGPAIDLEDASQISGYETGDLGIAQSSSDLAYVIYTSGSTGKPKGAMLAHAGAVNRLLWMRDEYAIGPGDAILQKTIYTFDVSVWELLLPGICGARQVFLEPGGEGDPAVIERALVESGITAMHFVPSMLAAFLHWLPAPRAFPALRLVFCSGEALTPAHKDMFFEKILGATELHNLYGPTEASIDVTYYPVAREDAQIPIGRPVANTRAYVLGAGDCLMPAGAPGELCLAGIQLARGYLNRPDLTEAKFVPDPFQPGARMYRTGDLASWRRDGQIVYHGRIDSQVKVRGYRIELGEIEEALRGSDEVEEAVVVAAPDGGGLGEKRLVAYLHCRAGAPPSATELRARLLDRLPQYMVPSAFVFLDEWPTNRNGKLDRARLPAPQVERSVLESEYEPPAPGLEAFIAETWAEALGLERVGANDDFFALGGDSIRSIQISARANDRGLALSPRLVFEFRSPRALARALEAGGAASGWRAADATAVPILPWQRFDDVAIERLDLEFQPGVSAEEVEARVRKLAEANEALRLSRAPDSNGLTLGAGDIVWVDLAELSPSERELRRASELESAARAMLAEAGPTAAIRIFDFGAGAPPLATVAARSGALDARSWALLATRLIDAETAVSSAPSLRDAAAAALAAAPSPEGALAGNGRARWAGRSGALVFDCSAAEAILATDNRLGLRVEEALLAAFRIAARDIRQLDTSAIGFEGAGELADVAGADYSSVLGALARPRAAALPEADAELDAFLKLAKEAARRRDDAGRAWEDCPLRLRYVGSARRSGESARVVAYPWDGDSARAPAGGALATASVDGSCIQVSLRYDADSFSESDMAELARRLQAALVSIGDCLAGLSMRDFTPSDFAESGLDEGSLNSFLANL